MSDWQTALNNANGIPPGELQNLTNGAVDPVENIKIGVMQAAEKAKEKAMKIASALYRMAPPSVKMIQHGHWPTFLTPWLMEEMERQEQEKKLEVLTKSE